MPTNQSSILLTIAKESLAHITLFLPAKDMSRLLVTCKAMALQLGEAEVLFEDSLLSNNSFLPLKKIQHLLKSFAVDDEKDLLNQKLDSPIIKKIFDDPKLIQTYKQILDLTESVNQKLKIELANKKTMLQKNWQTTALKNLETKLDELAAHEKKSSPVAALLSQLNEQQLKQENIYFTWKQFFKNDRTFIIILICAAIFAVSVYAAKAISESTASAAVLGVMFFSFLSIVSGLQSIGMAGHAFHKSMQAKTYEDSAVYYLLPAHEALWKQCKEQYAEQIKQLFSRDICSVNSIGAFVKELKELLDQIPPQSGDLAQAIIKFKKEIDALFNQQLALQDDPNPFNRLAGYKQFSQQVNELKAQESVINNRYSSWQKTISNDTVVRMEKNENELVTRQLGPNEEEPLLPRNKQ